LPRPNLQLNLRIEGDLMIVPNLTPASREYAGAAQIG